MYNFNQMKQEYKGHTPVYNSVHSYTMSSNPLKYTEEKSNWLYNLYGSKQNYRNKLHFQEHIIYMQALNGDIFDRLINHFLWWATVMQQFFQAFRLIVSNVRTHPSLSLPKWLWWKRDPNVRGYIMSNPRFCPLSPNMKKHSSSEREAGHVMSS